MDDLTAFLTARLDEDEAAAKGARPAPWLLEEETGGFGPVAWISMPFGHGMPTGITGLTTFVPLGTKDAQTMRHIARHDPARVLREVAAKRTFLRWFTSAEGEPLYMLLDQTPEELGRGGGTVLRGEWILREMAAVYSDHPDYRQEWKP